MASSSIHSPFQEALACQLCGFTKTIKVKCMDCNIFMCNDCKVKHSKFKDADLHKVIDIKHVASYSEENTEQLDFKSVKCQEHMDKICYMYCSDCKKMVCKTCISSKHKRHDLDEIENACRSKVDAVIQSCVKIDIDIKQCLETMKTTSETEYSKYQELKRKAKDEEKRALEKVQEKFVCKMNIIDKQWEEYGKHLSEKRETLTKDKKEIHTLRSIFQNAFDQRNPEMILKTIRDLEDRCKSCSTPSLESIPYWLQMDTSDVSDIKLSLKRHFTIKSVKLVKTISSDHENFIWIATNKNIQKIDPSNAKAVETYDSPTNITELRCTHSIGASLLVAATELHIFTYTGKFSVFRDLKPNIPFTIHISNDCHIVVGMQFLNEIDTENKPVIVVLGADGKILKEYINIKKRLLKHRKVQCCTSLVDGSLCYNDRHPPKKIGRTIKLDANGSVQWVYSRSENFNPIEVLATKINNIIISDLSDTGSCFHILSASGNLLRQIDLQVFEIDDPVVMTLDKNNCLWTASGTNLHCFEMIGF